MPVVRCHAPRLRQLARRAGYRVYLVDGERVRNEIDTDFTMGGNPERYRYVPRGEIWIDENLSPPDRRATILHEIVETKHMKRGLSYEKAHDIATAAEARFRARRVRP